MHPMRTTILGTILLLAAVPAARAQVGFYGGVGYYPGYGPTYGGYGGVDYFNNGYANGSYRQPDLPQPSPPAYTPYHRPKTALRRGLPVPTQGNGIPIINPYVGGAWYTGALPGMAPFVPRLDADVPMLHANTSVLNMNTPMLNPAVPTLNAGLPTLNASTPMLNTRQPVLNTAIPILQAPAQIR